MYHPGDAYFVPAASVTTLLLPTSGPWMKLGEAADYVRAVRPEHMVSIHDLLLSETGKMINSQFLGEQGLTGHPADPGRPSGSHSPSDAAAGAPSGAPVRALWTTSQMALVTSAGSPSFR